MDNRRIPATLNEFHRHLVNVNTNLHKTQPGDTLRRGEMLGMTPAELLTLKHFKQVWTSDDPLHPGVWDLHSRKDKKNALTRKNVLQVMNDFSVFFRPILMRISANPNITASDRIALRIAAPITKRSRPTLPISEKCIAAPVILGGGRIKFRCRTAHDSSRPSIPPRANALEMSYRLVLPHQTTPDGKKIPTDIINDPNRGTTKFLSTKASFMIEFELDYLGYQLQFYSRWINTRHPDINAPWTGPYVTYIG